LKIYCFRRGLIHFTKDDTPINVVVNTSKIFLDNKEYVLSIVTDITNVIEAKRELEHQKNTLNAIIYVLNEFVNNNNFNQSVENSLNKVIETLNVDRVSIFQNSMIDDKLVCSQKFEVTKEHIPSEINNPKLQNIPYDSAVLVRWKDKFLKDEHVEGFIIDFPAFERELTDSYDIVSILVMPIWSENDFWGFIGFDDCTTERIWNDEDKDVLKALANSFVSALNQENFAKNLQRQVSEQIKDLRKKDEQLLQQSKLAQMGEMIGMIAHQWRQPLNAISATSINISLLSNMKMLEAPKVIESSNFIQEQCQLP